MTESSVARHFHPPSRRQDAAALGAFVVLCLLAGGLGSLATTPAIPTWYAGLAKPWFNPPNAVFPVAWTVLYLLMALAAWLVWRARCRLHPCAICRRCHVPNLVERWGSMPLSA